MTMFIFKVVDLKLKNCVGIFARDETLTLGCDSIQDQDAWLYTLLNVYNSAKSGTPEENARPNFGRNVIRSLDQLDFIGFFCR